MTQEEAAVKLFTFLIKLEIKLSKQNYKTISGAEEKSSIIARVVRKSFVLKGKPVFPQEEIVTLRSKIRN
jgi:hypothetical protein